MNRTLEEAALLTADIARLRHKDLLEIMPLVLEWRRIIRDRSWVDENTGPKAELVRQAEEHLAQESDEEREVRRLLEATVRHDWLECLECSKRTESLALHVQRKHHISWDDYLTKHGLKDLPARFEGMDVYPKVSPSYVEKQRRNALARGGRCEVSQPPASSVNLPPADPSFDPSISVEREDKEV
ncbi:hypothetical protein F7D01_13830 [Erythrobacter sp. 3-20A1M]|uniref:MucR family transcriptional regulator n=1 Tax=Erythrobacter sp. 3-20A1M TaxID=2653850 RepID=UPI001BFC33BF|nr:MucR family transcriptional regulator [Erythrobacter sp. 3-20A1M]QWC58002.1 hypothetical protein F7D01_13830 [Erythrobacter sp. 3-20A1M]